MSGCPVHVAAQPAGRVASGLGTTAKCSCTVFQKGQESRGRRFALRSKARPFWDMTPVLHSEVDETTGEVVDLYTRPRHDRFASCGWRSQAPDGSVGMKYSTEKGAGYSGLHTCGSAWVCAPCAARIQRQRCQELTDITDWARQEAKTIALVTFTVRHSKGDSLGSVWDAVASGWASVTSGKNWVSEKPAAFLERLERWETARELALAGLGRMPRGGRANKRPVRRIGDQERFELLGWARATEVTHSRVNGWHVHIHVLMVLDGGQVQACGAAYRLADSMWERWSSGIGKVLNGSGKPFTALKSNVFGDVGLNVRVTVAAEKRLAEYMAKDGFLDTSDAVRAAKNKETRRAIAKSAGAAGAAAARETTHGGSKKARTEKGRTPFQILDDLVPSSGETFEPDSDVGLWRQWVEGSLGRRQLTTSAGLRALAGLSEETRSDEEIAAEELDGDLVLCLPRETWGAIRHESAAWLLMLENQGVEVVCTSLDALGLAWTMPETQPAPKEKTADRAARKERAAFAVVVGNAGIGRLEPTF